MRGEGAGPPFPTFCTTRSTEPFGVELSQDPASWSGRTGHPLGSCTGPPSWLSSNTLTTVLLCGESRPRSGAQRAHSLEEKSTRGQMLGRFVELKVPTAREVVTGEGPGGGSTGGSLRGLGQDHSHSVIITQQTFAWHLPWPWGCAAPTAKRGTSSGTSGPWREGSQ